MSAAAQSPSLHCLKITWDQGANSVPPINPQNSLYMETVYMMGSLTALP
jgi:hypothetical protein